MRAATAERGESGSGGGASRKRKSPSSSAASSAGRLHNRAALSSSSSSASRMMWVDKYAPLDDTSALCVAPKKVKEVREWLLRSHDRWSSCVDAVHGSTTDDSGGKLLILVGSPGVGKSATARALAAEMGWDLREWNDLQINANAGGGYRGGFGDSILSLPYQSQLSSFEEFLQSAGSGFESLGLKAGEDGGDRKLNSDRSGREKKKGKDRSREKSPLSDHGALILIEETPNLHTPEAADKFRSVMVEHIRRSCVPTIMIFSDVTEGKHRPDDLEKLVDPTVLYSSLVQIKQIQPVTKAKMKKCLEGIAKAEGLGRIPADFCEEVHCSSGGDVRHAIMALQFRYGAGAKRGGRAGTSAVGSGGGTEVRRDSRLSTFHALGKLLYAKRRKDIGDSGCGNGSFSEDPRPPLDFVPEDVMNESDMEHGGALSFLLYHSPDFFSDETELSRAFDRFSDAALFLGRRITSSRDRSDAVFPTQYVSSLAGRAVADANRHPTPNKFRAFSAPKIFEVLRKRRANNIKMLQLCKRLSCGSGTLPLNTNIGSSEGFVADSLPFMRTILPGEVNYALSNLHSYARQSEENDSSEPKETLFQREAEEQMELLKEDDIIDDDDSFGSDNEKENCDASKGRSVSLSAFAASNPNTKDSKREPQSPEVISILD